MLLISGNASPALAAPFFGREKRQLELCLVSVLRTQYWAMNVSTQIRARILSPKTRVDDEEVGSLADAVRKGSYLEARLGAKAILTQKVSTSALERRKHETRPQQLP